MAKPTLERPPSDRYRPSVGGETGGPGTPAGSDRAGAGSSATRPSLSAALAAVAGGGLLVLVGGILESTTGLVFVAGATGALIGLLYAGSDRPRASIRRRSVLAALVVVAASALG
ncbi:MAG TPA: hypothetical protein VNH13_03490, partial [Candidatus Acidoferrales bacterium]|nr:hypothetical protein [Candidatus Acidoferrales bacterium]